MLKNEEWTNISSGVTLDHDIAENILNVVDVGKSIVYIVRYRNQLEVAPLKHIFFLAVLKLDVKGFPSDATKKLKGWEKLSLQYELIIYKHLFININIT